MGLDMYLSGKKYLSPYSNQDDAAVIEELNEKFFPSKDGNSFVVKEVTAELAYWRKANAIHSWFVKNCQDGVDECQEAYVSRDHLRELRSVVDAVLEDNSKAGELLPPSAGFFFGSTDTGKWYIDDLQFTSEIITQILSSSELSEGWEFYYQSSW